jgi:DNA adenine methylase
VIRLTDNVIRLPKMLHFARDSHIHWLRGLLPPHLHYVEAYGPAVLLGKCRTTTETVNDESRDVYNFSWVLRDPILSCQLVELVSGKLAQSADRHQSGADQTPGLVERALRFFELCRRSMRWPASPRADGGIPDRLAIFSPICQRLHDVQVERLPVLDILHRYDSPFTCFLVDATAKPRQQLRASDDGGLPELLKAVLQVKGRVLVCGNAVPLFDEALVGWRKVQEPRSIGIPDHRPFRHGEGDCAWMNYPDPRDVG